MSLLAERRTTPETASGATVAGSYVTLPSGSPRARGEGTYVTIAGNRLLRPLTRGSYVTVAGAPAVAADSVRGSYVTLPAAA